MKKKSVIYGLKAGEQYHYIGKSETLDPEKQKINKSEVRIQYLNKNVRQVFLNNNIDVEILKNSNEWYGDKLKEVREKYLENNPLVNAQWMLEGKRGYWQGRVKDKHTIDRLSESKLINIVQYDSQGNYVKIWKGGKSIAQEVFGDYKLTKTGSESKIYDVLQSKCIKNRLAHNSYWFKESELKKNFNCIPKRINIEAIKKAEKQRRLPAYKAGQASRTYIRRRTVEHYQFDKLIRTYDNTFQAAYELKVKPIKIQRLCRKTRKNPALTLKYGRSTKQPVDIYYPQYEIKPLVYPKAEKTDVKKSGYQKTRTRYTVLQIDSRGKAVRKFDNVCIAEEQLGISKDVIRRICKGTLKSDIRLIYGDKKTILI